MLPGYKRSLQSVGGRPVPLDILDPTFGRTTIGSLNTGWGPNQMNARRSTLTEDGDVTMISWYGNNPDLYTANIKAAIYDDAAGSPNNLVGVSQERTFDGTIQWWDFTVSPAVSLSAGIYWITVWSGASRRWYYDVVVPNIWAYDTVTYDGWEDPWVELGVLNWDMSIYATYTPAAPPAVGGETHPYFVLAKGGI